MTSQPGWHPDPVPPQPGQPAQLRYWDGTRWTEHTAPAQAPAVGQYAGAPAQPPAYPATYGAAYPATSAAQPTAYGAAPGAALGYKPVATTPDGVPLAGWWWRVLAYLLDAIILGIIGGLIALPWIRDVWHVYSDWIDDALNSTSTGSDSTIDTAQLQRDLIKPLAIIGAINLALGFCYHVGFLMWKQATPGKLVVGLRVRLRERPGPMPFTTVLLRWLGQFGISILRIVPYAGSLAGLYSLLDDLWPLWDDKKQAIHDKIAKTNVVRVR